MELPVHLFSCNYIYMYDVYGFVVSRNWLLLLFLYFHSVVKKMFFFFLWITFSSQYTMSFRDLKITFEWADSAVMQERWTY